MGKHDKDILEYQPDAVEIEDRPVPGKARWVLYLILTAIVALIVGAIVFRVDRIVVASGELITSEPTLVVQPMNAGVIRTIEARVGDVVEEGQILATLDPTFASADLDLLEKQRLSLGAQLRRIEAELAGRSFKARPDEGADGLLQEQVLAQRRQVETETRRLIEDKRAALQARLELNAVQQAGQEKQGKVLRNMEGTAARRMSGEEETQRRLRLIEAQKARVESDNTLANLRAEAEVTRNELKQTKSEWERFVKQRQEELLEQAVRLRTEHNRVMEELHKAKRLHDLIVLKAPAKGVVLKVGERSVGSVLQQAEPFMVLVPQGTVLEAEVDVPSKDIGRIRTGDSVRIKLDAFPFQRHDTLPGEVRVISENAFNRATAEQMLKPEPGRDELGPAFYRCRVKLLGTQLKDVPPGFRLIPGMKVQAEIKVGTRSVISYFLYPIIRALDEGLREP